MSELAKSHIDIIDDSAYGAGTSAIIPLYVFATEQDKVIDEVIVGKTSIYLLTIDNKKIKITDIIDIEKSIS